MNSPGGRSLLLSRDRLARFGPGLRMAAWPAGLVLGLGAEWLARSGQSLDAAVVGPQEPVIGSTRLFVVPNPSPANFHYRPADQVEWYDRLADFIEITRREMTERDDRA